MIPEEVINHIWALLQTFKTMYHGEDATTVLLHPQLHVELRAWANQHYLQSGNPVDIAKQTIFGLRIITVHNRPYPFIAIAKAITDEQIS